MNNGSLHSSLFFGDIPVYIIKSVHSHECTCYAHISRILADLVIIAHMGHFIEGTDMLESYIAVQCECLKRYAGRF